MDLHRKRVTMQEIDCKYKFDCRLLILAKFIAVAHESSRTRINQFKSDLKWFESEQQWKNLDERIKEQIRRPGGATAKIQTDKMVSEGVGGRG